MNGLIMLVIALAVLGSAYLIYGRYLAKTWGIDSNAKTPAYELEDGVEYVAVWCSGFCCPFIRPLAFGIFRFLLIFLLHQLCLFGHSCSHATISIVIYSS